MTRVLNNIRKEEKIPDEQKLGTVLPIYKRGDKKEVGNYRGITMTDSAYTICAEVQ